MALPLLVSFIYDDGSTRALLFSMLISSSVGLIFFLLTREKESLHLNHRDGIAIVTLGWIMAGLFGTLPYLFSGWIPDFTNAYFEFLSGFTTTGASIVNDIEALPEGNSVLEKPDPVAGWNGYYRAFHCNPPVFRGLRDAAL